MPNDEPGLVAFLETGEPDGFTIGDYVPAIVEWEPDENGNFPTRVVKIPLNIYEEGNDSVLEWLSDEFGYLVINWERINAY